MQQAAPVEGCAEIDHEVGTSQHQCRELGCVVAHAARQQRRALDAQRSLNQGNQRVKLLACPRMHEPEVTGRLGRRVLERTNDYAQAGERYRTMPEFERDDLVANLIDLLGQCEPSVQERMVEQLSRCDADYAQRVADGIGVSTGATAR